jgi:GNAT superfamily N-acetyltransferase
MANDVIPGVAGPLSFAELDPRHTATRLQFPGLRPSMRSLVALTPDGGLAGEIRWLKRGGEIALVWVRADLQRHGIATALLSEARTRQPDVHHSTQLSEEARAWIAHLQAC